jgi:tRNA pseudouridine55 synthase
MTNNNQTTEISGFLLLNKPSGPTSHDMVYRLRRITGIKKIGHAGTLDPLASGLLIMAISRTATKQIDHLAKQDKVYEAVFQLGGTSDTEDRLGQIETRDIKQIPKITEIQLALNSLIGQIEQIPPMYSAKKIAGKKLYELARKGQIIERQPSLITIYKIDLIDYTWPLLKLTISCSTGTYIRSIARDLGEKLSCGAYLTELKRTEVGQYSITKSVNPEELTPENWTEYLFKNE